MNEQDPDPELERDLRAALEREARRIAPRDRLDEIRAATETVHHGGRPRWFAVAASAAAVAALAGGVWGLGLDRRDPPPVPGTSTSRSQLPQLPTRGTSPAPTPSGTTGAPGPTSAPPTAPRRTSDGSATTGEQPGSRTSTDRGPGPATLPPPPATATAVVPAYFVGPVGSEGSGLYRQFVRTSVPARPSPAETARAALEVAMAPDGRVPGTAYLQAWRGVHPARVTVGANGIHVTLSGPGSAGPLTGEQTRLAVQQLVWTAQAAVGRGNLPVTFAVADGSTALFGTYPTDATYRRPAQQFEDLAPLWITDPAPAAVLPAGTPVTARGQACVFEAAVSWELRRDGAPVRSGHTTASSGCPERGTWQVELGRLQPGTWTLRVFSTSAADGSVAAETASTFRIR
ncbi:MAG TPA: Gmad2 immunoglobulin-like domain-containing protein [Segeticoccus sp.]|nr:Gmad2 immunoglobulin-like domain-containing protein [Segeticoccus sp.]